ncbi:hypothetical protein BDZ89DRAFT_1145328 [Hymenopellis radicata]|nr:hypothetical protein BDZ89DRAFT_1145328 [Hymenopellis radicata]
MSNAEIPRAKHVHTARVFIDDDAFRRNFFAAIPNVENLATASFDVDLWFLDSRAAGHRLRSFALRTGSCISIVQLLDLLERAPLLETLKISRIPVPTSPVNLHVVTHALVSTFLLGSPRYQNNAGVFWFLAFRHSRQNFKKLGVGHDWLHKIVTLQLNKSGAPEDAFTPSAVPPSILEFLSAKPKGALDRPLPALKVLRVVVLPRRLRDVKRLV